jgi:hypothetical protein
MVFLVLSYHYPQDSHRDEYLRDAGDHVKQVSPFHKPLAASASDEQWANVLKAIRTYIDDPNILDGKSFPRPVKPNDDNYRAFAGPRWNPESSVDMSSIPASMAGLLQDNDPTTPYPRYDLCANCTKPATLQCARCKLVKYCSRNPCQEIHWKKVHKKSCIKACDLSLWDSLQGNDAFLVTRDECFAIQKALLKVPSDFPDIKVIQCFRAYLGVATELGGCFVV